MLIGIVGGTISGVLPGIHVNTLSAFLSKLGVGNNLLLFAMGLVHTFLDVIPSAFLGVPDEGTALGVLPAHRLILRGRAMEVVRIALWSSFLAVVLAVPLMPIYPKLALLYRPQIGKLILFFLIILLVLTEEGVGRLYALAIFLLSGILGVLTFRLDLDQPFYHLFTGLFGIPVILISFKGKGRLPEDSSGEWIQMDVGRFVGLSLFGTLLGMAASLVPAFTASQAALMGSFLSKDERSFLTVVYSVNTANFLFSFVNFLVTGRRRNGIVALMTPIPERALVFYVLAALFTALAVLLYGEPLAAFLLAMLRRIPYTLLNAAVLVSLAMLSVLFDGPLGFLVLTGASIVGLLAVLAGVKRTNCMGVLMLPILIG